VGTVPSPAHHPASSAQAVRAALLAGLRRRRLRERTRRLWQLAPLVAAAALVTAIGASLMGWPAWTALAVLAAGAATLAAHVLWAFHAQAPSDPVAAALDRDAGLDGELRSASWFAARDDHDAWADAHIDRAAERLAAVDWPRVYPPVPPGRSGITTAALTLAALVLAAVLPARSMTPTAAPAGSPDASRPVEMLRALQSRPPELLRQLAQLLAAAEAGDRHATQALSGNAALRERLSEMAASGDPRLLEALARAMAEGGQDQQALDAMEALAERIRRAAESAGMSAAMQEALDQLADEIEIATPEPTGAGSRAAADPLGGPDAAADRGTGGDRMEELTIQFAEDTTGGGGGVMILSQQPADGDSAPGAGVGGSPSGDIPPGTMAEIQAALDREVVEAHQETPGSSVETDRHRQTEEGRAEAAFTRGTAARAEATPLVSPPPVPEARRSGVRTYFVRPE
jgi:hypothetical protein